MVTHWQRTSKWHASPRPWADRSKSIPGHCTFPETLLVQPRRAVGLYNQTEGHFQMLQMLKDLKQECGPGKPPQGPTGPLHSPFPTCRRESKASESVTSPVTTRVNDKVRARGQKSPLLVPYQWEQGATTDPGSLQTHPSHPPAHHSLPAGRQAHGWIPSENSDKN